MRNLFVVIVLVLHFLLPGRLLAKDDMDLIKANYYYAHLSFHEAIPYYEKLATPEASVQIVSRLADCYRLTGDINKAAEWYRKALDMPRYADIVMLRYGQMLMELMQYEEAAKWLAQYQLTNLRDRRVANLIAACRTAPGRLKAAPTTVPVLLPFNSDHSEFAPTVWNGNLVFAADTAINLAKKKSKWTGNSCYNIYAVSCDAAGNCGDEFRTLGTAKNMNIAWHDGPATFNKDGDTMYFTRTRYNEHFFSKGSMPNKDSMVVLETMIATDFDEATQKFTRVRPFAFNSRGYSVAHPTVNASGNMMIFSSTQLGNGSDLYMCARTRKGKWLRPQNLGNIINTEGEEVFPYLANDSTLYFASDGHEGLGGLDIYVSHWDKIAHQFSKPENVGAPINSPYDDISMALNPDGSGGYFSSNRPAEKAGDNIYFYTR